MTEELLGSGDCMTLKKKIQFESPGQKKLDHFLEIRSSHCENRMKTENLNDSVYTINQPINLRQ